LGGDGGYLEMHLHKPLLIDKIAHSITVIGGCASLCKLPLGGRRPNLKKINQYRGRSLLLVTAPSPLIGLRRAVEDRPLCDDGLTLKEAAFQLGLVGE
jgi:fumarate hydratase, class II